MILDMSSVENAETVKIGNIDNQGGFHFQNFQHRNIAGVEIRLLEDTDFWVFIRDIYIR